MTGLGRNLFLHIHLPIPIRIKMKNSKSRNILHRVKSNIYSYLRKKNMTGKIVFKAVPSIEYFVRLSVINGS